MLEGEYRLAGQLRVVPVSGVARDGLALGADLGGVADHHVFVGPDFALVLDLGEELVAEGIGELCTLGVSEVLVVVAHALSAQEVELVALCV